MEKISLEDLTNLYTKDLLTDEEIGRRINAHENTVRTLRRKYGIRSIGPRERERALKGGFSPISDRQMEIILGSLLGDSSLKGTSRETRSLSVSHSIKQKDYLEWIYNEISPICPSGISEYFDKRGYITYSLLTEARTELKEIYDELYFPKKKITPWIMNRISPLSLATWYMDDGSYNYINKSKSEFCFATNCFSEEENYLAQDMVKKRFDIELIVKHIKKGSSYQCNLIVSSEDKFLEVILPHIPSCMRHKVPSTERVNFLAGNIKTEISKEDLEDMYHKEGLTQDEIAFKINVSRSTVQKYMHLYGVEKRTNAECQKKRNAKRDNSGKYKKLDLTREQEERSLKIFRQLRSGDFPYYKKEEFSSYCSILERLKNNSLEIDERGNYKFSSSGMKIIRDFCPQIFHMARKGSLSPIKIFSDDKMLLDSIRRTIKYSTRDSIPSVINGLKTYRNNRCVSNFPPIWSKSIIEKYGHKKMSMLDFSCGFGGRILGSYASSMVDRYIGVDPCKINLDSNVEIGKVIDYHKSLNNSEFSYELHNSTAEDFFKTFNKKVDMVLTSPPYFDLEIYDHSKSQSYVNYNNYEIWKEKWLTEILKSCHSSLKDNGFCCIFFSNNQTNKLMDDAKDIMEKIFGNTIVENFLLPKLEYNRNDDSEHFDNCIISQKVK